jgi:hypothetical protein
MRIARSAGNKQADVAANPRIGTDNASVIGSSLGTPYNVLRAKRTTINAIPMSCQE